MGGGSTKEEFPESRHYSILDYGYCKVWKRADSQRETMEQYEVVIDSQKMLAAYKRMWLLRAQEEAVVGVFYFTHRPNKELCGFYQHGSILTERIPYRLSQFANVPYEEMLYLLRVALQAYQALHAEYGLFLVRSTMVGINLNRQVKVWHHTDLSAAEPENPHCRSGAEMIDSIIESVEINAEVPVYYPKFSDFVKANRSKIEGSFEDTLRALASYIKMNRIPRCEGTPKLTNYLRQAEGWEEMTYNSNFLTNLSNISHLNRTLLTKHSFRNSDDSVNSSRRTLKNSPGYSIYTQKEFRLDHRSKERSIGKSPARRDPLPHSERYQYVPRPLEYEPSAEDMSQLRGKSIQNSSLTNNNHKIEIKIPSRRMAGNPSRSPSPVPKFETISSIDQRICDPTRGRNALYYEGSQQDANFQATQPNRTNRFHQQQQSGHDYIDRRNESRSPAGISYIERRNQSRSPSGIYYRRG